MDTTHGRSGRERGAAQAHRPHAFLRYGLAVAAVAATVPLRFLLTPLVEGHVFFFFFPAVIASARYGGYGPATLASALAVVAANYFFLSPLTSFDFLTQGIEFAVFLGTAYLMGSSTARLHEARLTAERAHRQLDALVSTAADGIVVIDDRGIIRRVNAAVERTFGYSADETVGQNVSMLMPAPYGAGPDGYPERHRRTGEPPIVGAAREVQGRRRDGTTFPLDLAVSEAAVGNDVLFTGIVRDVTDRKRAELQEHLLATAGKVLTEALEVDEALRRVATMCARAFADYCVTYALDEEDRIRRVGAAHSDPDRQRLVERLLELSDLSTDDRYGAGQVLRTGEAVFAPDIPHELLARAAQSAEHLEVLTELDPLSSIILPFRARGRTLGAISLTTTSCSGRRYTDSDLDFAWALANRIAMGLDNLHLLREARRAASVRDDVVAVVSHDLRDSLNVVLNAAQLLRDLDLDASRRGQQLDALIRAAGAMERLTSDLLDVARMEAGLFAVDPGPMELSHLLEEVVDQHRSAFQKKQVRLQTRIPERLPTIRADGWRLRQLLGNLLGNALKFTPPGGEVELAADVDEAGLTLRVRDTGPGVAPEDLPRLFDRFYRGSRPGSGTGLGLTIARGIAVAHGGEIGVLSRPGEGTTFQVILPDPARGERTLDQAAATEGVTVPRTASVPDPGPIPYATDAS